MTGQVGSRARRGGNIYEFVGGTYNPLAGACTHDCSYCYVKRLSARLPALRRKYSGPLCVVTRTGRIPRGEVFLCSCNDLFQEALPIGMIQEILDRALRNRDGRTWLLQTKNPTRALKFIPEILELGRIGVTVEGMADDLSKAPGWEDRLAATKVLTYMGVDTFITIEPIVEFAPCFAQDIIKTGVKQVYIGADTGGNNLPEPTAHEIRELIRDLEGAGVRVDLKKNLERLLSGGPAMKTCFTCDTSAITRPYKGREYCQKHFPRAARDD